jgi:SAM-dependent methyltransferase
MTDMTPASPYDEPELYDFLFENLDFDLPFLLETARAAGGPVLEVGCGTGRVLLRLLAAGIDAEGVEPSAPMRERLTHKARERGLEARVAAGDARDFSRPRRFALVLMPFNAFSHLLALDDQLAALRRMLAHLAPGGALVVHQSVIPPGAWGRPDGERELEHEVAAAAPGHVLRIWDTRFRDPVAATQHSLVDVEESDATGGVVRAFRSETRHAWHTRNELELLLRLAGAGRVEIRGDAGRAPLAPGDAEMWAFAWKD